MDGFFQCKRADTLIQLLYEVHQVVTLSLSKGDTVSCFDRLNMTQRKNPPSPPLQGGAKFIRTTCSLLTFLVSSVPSASSVVKISWLILFVL